MKMPARLLLALAALLLAGCSSIDSRIEEKSAAFNALAPDAQSRVREGIIAIGDTADVVYIAMGRPDDIREKTTADSRETVWIYRDYWQEYEGTQLVGFHRRVYYHPSSQSYRTHYVPVQANVYRERTEERTRVVFRDGKVAVIEQVK